MRFSKTLYVSDLDGTLLTPEKNLSPFTIETIHALCAEGMIFSYATARSYYTAQRVTNGLSVEIPTINHNGAFVFENGTKRVLLSNAFPHEESEKLLDRLLSYGMAPIVYSLKDGNDRFSYCADHCTPWVQHFLDAHRDDPRANPVDSVEALYDGDIFFILCPDEEERVSAMYAELSPIHQCISERELYSGDAWLEILPKEATKANAILKLKDILGCDRVVCFGDGMNDLSMFRIADACYAMKNAVPALKEIATDVIGSNSEDGVAKWLLQHVDAEVNFRMRDTE